MPKLTGLYYQIMNAILIAIIALYIAFPAIM